jgi:hypothetical protein
MVCGFRHRSDGAASIFLFLKVGVTDPRICTHDDSPLQPAPNRNGIKFAVLCLDAMQGTAPAFERHKEKN